MGWKRGDGEVRTPKAETIAPPATAGSAEMEENGFVSALITDTWRQMERKISSDKLGRPASGDLRALPTARALLSAAAFDG